MFGTRHYNVKLDNGREIKRHINQLKKTLVPETPRKRLFFSENLYFPITCRTRDNLDENLPTSEQSGPCGYDEVPVPEQIDENTNQYPVQHQ